MGSEVSAKAPNRIVTATPTATAAGERMLASVSARMGSLIALAAPALKASQG